MNWLITTLITGVTVFAATNIDDLVILTIFFSQVNPTFHQRHITLGQYLGFTALLSISLLGYFGELHSESLDWLGTAIVLAGCLVMMYAPKA